MRIHILLPGYPIKGSRGYLGWSTVILLENRGEWILFDTASYGDRYLLIEGLKKYLPEGEEIQYVVLSHLHFDHALNVDLFPKAQIVLSRREWEYAISGEHLSREDYFISFPLIEWLKREKERLLLFEDGEPLTEEITVHLLPGHTPGSLGLNLNKEETLLIGDAVKSGMEFITAYPAYHFASIEEWQKSYQIIKQAKTIIPGHDVPLHLKKGEITRWERAQNAVLEYTPLCQELNCITLRSD